MTLSYRVPSVVPRPPRSHDEWLAEHPCRGLFASSVRAIEAAWPTLESGGNQSASGLGVKYAARGLHVLVDSRFHGLRRGHRLQDLWSVRCRTICVLRAQPGKVSVVSREAGVQWYRSRESVGRS
jgi:hypothetical protein